ncbi:MAG: hypothetical protein WC776_05510 [Patescibacteria group bacterium]|jgi:hypothetical protein
MKTQEIIALFEKVDPSNMGAAEEIIKTLDQAFNDMGDVGKKIVTERMLEKDYARVRTALVNTLVSEITVHSQTKGLLLALMEETIVVYTDSFFTAMLGFLVENEVL